MFLHSTSSYTEISGYANKSFRDKVTNGVLTNPGDWGDDTINWFGAALGARGR